MLYYSPVFCRSPGKRNGTESAARALTEKEIAFAERFIAVSNDIFDGERPPVSYNPIRACARVAERQTQRIQNPPLARVCGFKSHPGHHIPCAPLGVQGICVYGYIGADHDPPLRATCHASVLERAAFEYALREERAQHIDCGNCRVTCRTGFIQVPQGADHDQPLRNMVHPGDMHSWFS